MTNEIISKQVAAELVVDDPFNVGEHILASDAAALSRSGFERVRVWEKKIADMGELGNFSQVELKAVQKTLDAEMTVAKDYPATHKNAVVAFVGMNDTEAALAKQFNSKVGIRINPECIYGRFKALHDKLEAAIKAQTPPEPTHTYIMQMEITDGDLKKVVAAVTKCGARFRVAEATKGKDMKWAERFFAEMI